MNKLSYKDAEVGEQVFADDATGAAERAQDADNTTMDDQDDSVIEQEEERAEDSKADDSGLCNDLFN